MEQQQTQWAWVFHGDGAQFASAVFATRDAADRWIREHGLSGMLTGYPLGMSVLDWVKREGLFEAKLDWQKHPKLAQKYTSMHLPHEHYRDGFTPEEDGFARG